MSGMLLLVAVIGLYQNAKTVSEIRLNLFSSKETDASPALNSQPERRRAPRYKSHAVLDLIDASGRSVPHVARLLNLSRTGVCFYSAESLRRGKRIQACLHASKESVHEISGHVVWRKSRGRLILYGVHFETVLPEEFLAEARSSA